MMQDCVCGSNICNRTLSNSFCVAANQFSLSTNPAVELFIAATMPPKRVSSSGCLKVKAGAGISTKKRLHSQKPTPLDKTVLLFRKWMRRKMVFTGRTENANKCARILHVWQSFVADNADFLLQNFKYKPKTGKAAGQLGKMFALFRDKVLPAALQYGHVRSDVEDTLSTTQGRHVKTSTRADGQHSARSIQGWEFVRPDS